VKRGEALQRLRNITVVLRALGVPFTPRGESIEVTGAGLPFVFQVRTASAHTEVGPTIALLWCDEVSRWRDDATGVNPASEVLAALKPALATIRDARIFLISSPLSTSDFHAKEYARGESDGDQCVDCFATWEANDLLTEEDTRQLERDPRVWAREYAATPQASISAAFPDGVGHVVSVGVRERPYVAGTEYAVAIDAGGASRTGKSETVITAAHVEHRQVEVGGAVLRTLVIDCIRMLKPAFLRPVKFEHIVDAAVTVCRAYHVTVAASDLHLYAALQPALSQNGIQLLQVDMSLPAQAKRSAALVSMVQSSSIDLLDHADLRRQMGECVLRERGQHFVITKPDRSGARDDVVDTVLLLAERQAKLTATGSAGIEYDPGKYFWSHGEGLIFTKQPSYYCRDASGHKTPIETPLLATQHREHQLERWRQGISTPGDLREYGSEEALAQAMNEALYPPPESMPDDDPGPPLAQDPFFAAGPGRHIG
jgi:hypothetical protein